MKCEFFLLKKHVKLVRMVKSALFKVCYIFLNSRAICEYHAGINLPLSLRTIHRAIFSHLRMNQSAAQQVCEPSMHTGGSRKGPSLMSKPHGVQLSSRDASNVSRTDFAIRDGELLQKKWLYVPSFSSASIWSFLKQGTVQIGKLLLVTFSINHFPRFQQLSACNSTSSNIFGGFSCPCLQPRSHHF